MAAKNLFAALPEAFGWQFSTGSWNQSYVSSGDHIFLLVTMDDSNVAANAQFDDRFLSESVFEWKSQNRHRRESTPGKRMRTHVENGVQVHLLVRKNKRIDNNAAPFVYCGEVDFQDWEGDKPITIRWRLHEPLTPELRAMFEVA